MYLDNRKNSIKYQSEVGLCACFCIYDAAAAAANSTY